MIIGVPTEVKDHETRVGLAPGGSAAPREAGHAVLSQSTAGEGRAPNDREYMQAGATVPRKAEDAWRRAGPLISPRLDSVLVPALGAAAEADQPHAAAGHPHKGSGRPHVRAGY